MFLENILVYKIWGNTVENILLAAAVFFIVYLCVFLFRVFIEQRLELAVSKTTTKFDDIFVSALVRFMTVGGFLLSAYIAKDYLVLHHLVHTWMNLIVIILSSLIVTWVIQELILDIIDEYFAHVSTRVSKTFLPFLKFLVKVFLWLIVGIFILSNLGYTVSSLAAGLGISGLAIAIAVRPTLESFFASLSLFANRPFAIGDYIQFDGQFGTVENIGLRTTSLRTPGGTELIIPNTQLIASFVENIQKRSGERVDANIGVVYSTSSKKLEKAIVMIKDILKAHERVEEDIRVWFSAFGESGLIIRVTYFVDANLEYVDRMEVVSFINFQIKKSFEDEGVEMAIPTQMVYVKNVK